MEHLKIENPDPDYYFPARILTRGRDTDCWILGEIFTESCAQFPKRPRDCAVPSCDSSPLAPGPGPA